MSNENDSRNLQVFPRGTSYAIRGQFPAYEVRVLDYNNRKNEEQQFRPATEQETKEIYCQELADNFQRNDVGHCVSSLVSHFAQNQSALEGSDYSWDDDILPICQADDYTEPVEEFVNDMSAVSCREYLDEQGEDYSDIIPEPELDDDGDEIDVEPTAEQLAALRARVLETIRSEDDWQEFAQSNRIEPYTHEAYEHWIVTSWLGEKLKADGQIVGELFGLTIWGRTTTGQGMIMDGVLQRCALQLAEDTNTWQQLKPVGV